MTAGTAAQAVSRFQTYLGTHEQPPGSNHVPGITDFLHTPNGTGTGDSPWCAETVSRVLADIGQSDFFGHQFVNGIAYVPYITALARSTGRLIPKTSGQPGDVCIFVWGGAGSNTNGDHTGMVVYKNADGSYHTIEGNAGGPDGVGDEVAFHDRPVSELLGFYRPAYAPPNTVAKSTPVVVPRPTPPPPVAHPGVPSYPGFTLHLSTPFISGAAVKTWQTQMTARGWKLTADGVYGPASDAVCKQFQTEKHLTVDGIVGPATWAAAWTSPIS
jgi:hypothetical protein